MKYLILFTCVLFISGCAGMTEMGPDPVNSVGVRKVQQPKELVDVAKVSVGMTKEEVLTALGSRVVVGYEKMDSDASEPVAVENPYRARTLTGGQVTFDVEYYFTHIQRPDDVIAENELTPLVYENGKLSGTGWQYLQDLIERYNLK